MVNWRHKSQSIKIHICFSPLTSVNIFSSIRSHVVHWKGRDFAADLLWQRLWCQHNRSVPFCFLVALSLGYLAHWSGTKRVELDALGSVYWSPESSLLCDKGQTQYPPCLNISLPTRGRISTDFVFLERIAFFIFVEFIVGLHCVALLMSRYLCSWHGFRHQACTPPTK